MKVITAATAANIKEEDDRLLYMMELARLARRAGSTTSLRSPTVWMLRNIYSGRPQRLLTDVR